MNNAPWDTLAGQYYLRPGAARSVVGQRPILGAGRLGRMLRGQRAPQVGRTLSSVFTLCAHAHRHTAALALAAAQGQAQELTASEPPLLLWLETARDHLRSIALDWPQRLPDATGTATTLDWLRDCPLSLAAGRPDADANTAWAELAQLRAWLERRIVGQSLADYLPAHRHPDALARWCQAQAARLPLAHCLASWHTVAHALTPAMRCLNVLDEDVALQSVQLCQLAQNLVKQPDFAQQPTWLGQCAENGPWTRLRQRPEQGTTPHSAWSRVSARWIELLEIAAALPQPRNQALAPLLASGALQLGTGEALAWCEMARGLLLHWVHLDAQGGVQDYRVLAPTEWNFHPDGALAGAVAALAPDDTLAAQMLAAAFDPCVACTVQTPVAREIRC